jgi:hypothetical protein
MVLYTSIENIPYHDNIHRQLLRRPPHSSRMFHWDVPFSPKGTPLYSTIEVVPSREILYDRFHQTCSWNECDDGADLTYEEWSAKTNHRHGFCLRCVAVLSDEATSIHMVTREPENIYTEEETPPRFYKTSIPIMQGVNYIVWCVSMRLTVMSKDSLEYLLGQQGCKIKK